MEMSPGKRQIDGHILQLVFLSLWHQRFLHGLGRYAGTEGWTRLNAELRYFLAWNEFEAKSGKECACSLFEQVESRHLVMFSQI